MSESHKFEIRHFLSAAGKDPYELWLEDLDAGDADRVDAYVTRIESGNFGNSRPVGDGVLELKVNVGPGYRVYYLRDGERIVLLLCGGDKGSQSRDIRKAKECVREYWRRK